ncbi:MAG: sugar transferase [Rhodospirillales bacterium]|nr:MAG: sugar transferase [Rhodospirillales bacterium]
MRRLIALRSFQIWEGLVFLGAVYAGVRATEGWGPVDVVGPGAVGVLLLAVLWSSLLATLGLYKSRRFGSRVKEAALLIGVTTAATAVLSLVGTLSSLPFAEAAFAITFWVGLTAAIVGGRMVVRLLLGILRSRGRNIRYAVIVGAGPRGQALAERLASQPRFGFRVLGFVDDEAHLKKLPAICNALGSFDTLSRVLAHQPVDEVLIALPVRSNYDNVYTTLKTCERLGVAARLFVDFFDLDGTKSKMEAIGAALSVKLYTGPSAVCSLMCKRMIDVVVAAAALLVLSPLLFLIGLAVRLDSRGPALFLQKRVGQNKRVFKLYKFRTMVQDAEARMAALESLNEASGPVFKIAHDPRITRIGGFLRRYSLDELPQLINVLRGEMSLVGPRPLPLRDVERFEEDWHSRRFSVMPGLTCSWVLSGRSTLSFDKWVALDLEYIDSWSLWNDVKIFFKTIPAVFRGAGSY